MAIATAENGWTDTTHSHHSDVLALVRQILQAARSCTLSTCSAEGILWASPVFFCCQNLTLYWLSAITSRPWWCRKLL